MRLAAQSKGGFYPAPAEAVRLAASLLTPPDQPYAILDPCCGKGAAIQELAAQLGTPREMIWAIELDEGRAVEAKADLAGANVLAPASFLGVAATLNSFSLAWVNPPFDDEIGGGRRVEYAFLQRATQWLRANGVMLLVCPEHVSWRSDIRQYLMQGYQDLAWVPFLEQHRSFDEVILIGRKLAKPPKAENLWDEVCKESVEPGPYAIPPGNGPRKFEKVDFTEAELAQALAGSPLRKHLEPPPDIALAEPPLPLAHGHIALLLASGKLDGAVRPRNEPAHVVRGTARKDTYLASQTEDEAPDGSVIHKTTYSERIVLTIRAVGPDGTIKTFE
jgi:hypothetical protein